MVKQVDLYEFKSGDLKKLREQKAVVGNAILFNAHLEALRTQLFYFSMSETIMPVLRVVEGSDSAGIYEIELPTIVMNPMTLHCMPLRVTCTISVQDLWLEIRGEAQLAVLIDRSTLRVSLIDCNGDFSKTHLTLETFRRWLFNHKVVIRKSPLSPLAKLKTAAKLAQFGRESLPALSGFVIEPE